VLLSFNGSQVTKGRVMKISARGFSLIELLIVIGIILALTTFAFPQYINYTN
jgi:prepilin-type N-terminal cleavage/methylation domain-containing protein